MPYLAVYILLFTLAIYLAAGVLFTLLFLLVGIEQIDEDVDGSSIGFRIIIIPGCIFLWPVLLRKWAKSERKKSRK